MANKAQLGEIRTWKDGRKYQKTAAGWAPVKSGSGRGSQEESPDAENGSLADEIDSNVNDFDSDEIQEALSYIGYYDEENAEMEGPDPQPSDGEGNSNQQSQQSSYTPEQLADYAKSASDEGLKRAASSGDEQMRIAAKREIARRKNEGMESDTDNPFDKGTVRKSQKEERIFKGQVYEKVEDGWIKKMSDELEKGKAGQLGEIRVWGNKKYQKTAKGWRPVKAGAQSEKPNKEESPEEKALKRDNDWAKTIKEYTACGGGNFGKVLEKKPNGDLLVEYIRRGEKPWTDIVKKGSEDWKHLKDEKPLNQKDLQRNQVRENVSKEDVENLDKIELVRAERNIYDIYPRLSFLSELDSYVRKIPAADSSSGRTLFIGHISIDGTEISSEDENQNLLTLAQATKWVKSKLKDYVYQQKNG